MRIARRPNLRPWISQIAQRVQSRGNNSIDKTIGQWIKKEDRGQNGVLTEEWSNWLEKLKKLLEGRRLLLRYILVGGEDDRIKSLLVEE